MADNTKKKNTRIRSLSPDAVRQPEGEKNKKEKTSRPTINQSSSYHLPKSRKSSPEMER